MNTAESSGAALRLPSVLLSIMDPDHDILPIKGEALHLPQKPDFQSSTFLSVSKPARKPRSFTETS